jgi:hypothetical protein
MHVMRGSEQGDTCVHHNYLKSCLSASFTTHAVLVLMLKVGTSAEMRESLVVIRTMRSFSESLGFESQSVTYEIQISLQSKFRVLDLDPELILANSKD